MIEHNSFNYDHDSFLYERNAYFIGDIRRDIEKKMTKENKKNGRQWEKE